MYKDSSENVEVYFICYKKEEMDLVDTYYDPVLDIHYWYFNAFLAYKYWQNNFKGLELGKIAKMLLIVAASRYIIYVLENKEYKTAKEHKRLLKDLEKIEPKLQKVVDGGIKGLKIE